jgi:MFS family permease
MSLSAALGTATIYLLQPAIADVAASLGASLAGVGAALGCGPVGYLCGLGLLVPLVDRFRPRYLPGVQFGAPAAALALTSLVGNVWVLGAMIGITGACSSVGACLSSVAGRLAPAHRRATVQGLVTVGISAGILTGRIIGGWLAQAIGWREMVLVFAGACAVIAAGSVVLLPAVGAGAVDRGYLATLRSIPGLFVRHVRLRVAAVRGTLWFFAFCAVWSGLAVALSKPPYSYSSEHIGLYALAGLLGIVATRVSGLWTDRSAPTG